MLTISEDIESVPAIWWVQMLQLETCWYPRRSLSPAHRTIFWSYRCKVCLYVCAEKGY